MTFLFHKKKNFEYKKKISVIYICKKKKKKRNWDPWRPTLCFFRHCSRCSALFPLTRLHNLLFPEVIQHHQAESITEIATNGLNTKKFFVSNYMLQLKLFWTNHFKGEHLDNNRKIKNKNTERKREIQKMVENEGFR